MNSAEVSCKLILVITALVLFVLEWPPLSGSITFSEGSDPTPSDNLAHPRSLEPSQAPVQLEDPFAVRRHSGEGDARNAVQAEADTGFIKGVWPIRRVYVNTQAQAIICWLYKNALRVRPR